MQFWASAEVYAPAGEALERCRRCVEPYLNMAFRGTSLDTLAIELRFVPIVMPKDSHAKYAERSRNRIKQRILVCAPHLDFETFVRGNLDAQVREYLRGIALSAPALKRFGGSDDDVRTFEAILQTALPHIILVRPDKTRH